MVVLISDVSMALIMWKWQMIKGANKICLFRLQRCCESLSNWVKYVVSFCAPTATLVWRKRNKSYHSWDIPVCVRMPLVFQNSWLLVIFLALCLSTKLYVTQLIHLNNPSYTVYLNESTTAKFTKLQTQISALSTWGQLEKHRRHLKTLK